MIINLHWYLYRNFIHLFVFIFFNRHSILLKSFLFESKFFSRAFSKSWIFVDTRSIHDSWANFCFSLKNDHFYWFAYGVYLLFSLTSRAWSSILRNTAKFLIVARRDSNDDSSLVAAFPTSSTSLRALVTERLEKHWVGNGNIDFSMEFWIFQTFQIFLPDVIEMSEWGSSLFENAHRFGSVSWCSS